MSAHVLLVENDTSYCGAVAAALKRHGFAVLTASAGKELRQPPFRKQLARVHAALVDLRLEPYSGLSVIAALRADAPDLKIAALTAHSTDDDIFGALAAGADGYMLKSDPIAALPKQVDALLADLSPLSPSIARRVIQHFARPSQLPIEAALSIRELSLLQLLAAGFTFVDCADRMQVTQETIRTMVKRIRQKLHAGSVTEAVSVGFRAGLLK